MSVYNNQETRENYCDNIFGRSVLKQYNNALVATNNGIGYITTTGDLMILTPNASYTNTTSTLLPSKISAYKRFTHDPLLTGIVATSRSFQIGGAMFLKYDGTLYGIRAVSYYNTGLSTAPQYYIHECATNVKDFDICSTHGIILKNDGTVWTSGYNNRGMLGQGNTTTYTNWTQVSGITGTVHSVACCDNHSYITEGSVVKACGYNNQGACGTGNTTQVTTFTSTSGMLNTSTESMWATTGNLFATTPAGLYACGANTNSSGRIQGHATANVSTAIQVCTGATNVVGVSLNASASVVLDKDGSWWFSGTNTNGLAGYNNGTTNQSTYYHSTTKTTLKFMDIKLSNGVSIAVDHNGYIYTAGKTIATGNGDLNASASSLSIFTQADFPQSSNQGTRHKINSILTQIYNMLPSDLTSVIGNTHYNLAYKNNHYNDRETRLGTSTAIIFLPSLKEVTGANTEWLHPLENSSTMNNRFSHFSTITNFSGGNYYCLTRSKPSKEYLNTDIDLCVYGVLTYAIPNNNQSLPKIVKPCFCL